MQQRQPHGDSAVTDDEPSSRTWRSVAVIDATGTVAVGTSPAAIRASS